MSENIDDLTIAYEENGVEVVKELDKVILTRGAWSTIIFKLKNFDNKLQDFGPVRYTIRRYQKRNGVYTTKSKFNISSSDQAKQIIEALTKWVEESEE